MIKSINDKFDDLQKFVESDFDKNHHQSLDRNKSPRESMESPDIKQHPEFKSLEELFSNLKTRIQNEEKKKR